MARILVVEDEAVLARNTVESLKARGHDASCVFSAEEARDALKSVEPELIILDLKLPGQSGLELLQGLRREGHPCSVIVMTAHGDVETAVESMKQGASDFVTKSGRLAELHHVVERVLREESLSVNLEYFKDRERREGGLAQIIGEAHCMRELKMAIRRLTSSPALLQPSPPTVLITGETGTGKDMVARAIHFEGPRCEKPFVDVNCTAVPEELFESELFGHTRGAFTDAKAAKRGLFAVADGGTLFLDEIGHLSLGMQAKLLTAIDRQQFRPVGATESTKVDVHILAATNRDLESAVARGEFRGDLYHRLCFVTFRAPPLRERREDIPLLARHFLAATQRRLGLKMNEFEPEALIRLASHDWPGNVRELLHLVESAVIMAPGRRIRSADLRLPSRDGAEMAISIGEADLVIDFASGHPTLDEVEEAIIRKALEYSRHNVSRAARILGLSRDTLRYRLQKLGLH